MFIDLLHKFGIINDDVKKFIHKFDENYPKDVLYIYAENEQDEKQAAQDEKQTKTGGLAKLLKLKIVAKVMSTVNIEIQDRLINGQTGNIRLIEFAQGSASKMSVKFSDEQADLKAMRSSYLCRQNYWLAIEK